MAPKITLDTNCIIGLLDRDATTPTSLEEVHQIMRYGLSGRVEVAITTRVEEDLSRDKNVDRRSELLRTLSMFPVVGTVARWDVSRWDAGDVWGDDETERLWSELQKVVFPGLTAQDRRYENKRTDIDHLLGHLINKRDIFVTDDTGILRKHEALKGQGVIVMSPAASLQYVDHLEERRQVKELVAERDDPRYRSAALSGTVVFDYSNNNGSFVIGTGLYLFETKWTKASDTFIHAYTDARSISGVAIAKGTFEIQQITDAESLDYSSRVRTPQEGQIAVWRNVNGLYAATKILDVKDETRGDDRDELIFEYRILSNGGHSFANPA